MKSFLRALFGISIIGALALSVACARGGGGAGPMGSATTPQGPVFEGTVSGGGGNGCDGKAFEADSKRISEFEEYRLYVRPLLRRMSEEGSDPLVTYLMWAAEEKAWFFIPCEIKKLSNQQIGISVDSDQLARHGEHGIYIHAIEDTPERAREREQKHLPPLNTYYQKKAKERAALLLHEMVMGARLLMKKSAKEQCTALAKKDANLCADPEVMAIAEAREVAPDKAKVMDAEDHEAVRAMTTYLAEKGSDLSADAVKANRQRLGFYFPWDRATSNIDYAGLIDAFSRSAMLGDQYRVAGTAQSQDLNPGRSALPSINHPYFKDVPVSCGIGLYTYGGSDTQVSLTFATDALLSTQTYNLMETLKKKMNTANIGSICKPFAGHIYQSFVKNEKSGMYEAAPCAEKQELMSIYDYRASFQLSKANVKARGSMRDKVVFDEVSLTMIENPEYSRLQMGPKKLVAGEIKILVTREKTPRIESITFYPKQILKASKPGTPDDSAAPELLDIPDTPPIECARVEK